MLGENSGKIKKSKRGFTLIEMLVVVFVLGVGLIGALSFFNVNLNNQFEAKNELIAAGLAQEGVDLVRNIKDYNQLNPPKAWDFNLTGCSSIDFNSLINHRCVLSGSPIVCQDGNSRYYQCPGGNTTIFRRSIEISSLSPNSKSVKCKVTWNGRITEAIDVLYNNSY